MAKQKNETIKQRALIQKYNKLAKKADRMMRELERFSRYEEFKDIKKYAYRVAEKDIEKWTPDGLKGRPPRWQRGLPLNEEGKIDTRNLAAKIKDIENFISLPSATITGIKRTYKKRAQAINDKYGTNFTWQELAHFFEDGGLFDKTKNYGSKTVLVAYGQIQHKKDKVLKKIQDFNDKNIVISDNKVVEDTINNMLSEYGTDIEALIS